MNSIVALALAAPWVLGAGQAWILYSLFRRQNGVLLGQKRIEDQLEAIEHTLTSLPIGVSQPAPPRLEIGDPAPDFSLSDLSGRQRRLEEFLVGPLVLGFFSPTCGFCVAMASRIGQLPLDGRRLVLISSGDIDENLRLAMDNNWRCDVLLDSTGQTAEAYRISGTPSGYLLASDGHVLSDLAVGADALLSLVTKETNQHDAIVPDALQAKQQAAVKRASDAGLHLTESRLNRKGLEAGTKAPEFVLPSLNGDQHSLASFLDKRVLLVFSDPNCGPCDALAPELVRLHNRHLNDGLRVVMISRGDPDANRAKATKHGLPFTVLLQRQWEISKDYAMFATPVGYLIDQSGVISKPVAFGAKAILDLV